MRATLRRGRPGMRWHYCGVTTIGPVPFDLSRVAPTPAPARRRAAWAVAALVLLVLVVHLLLLSVVPRAPGPGWQAPPARWVQVRQIVVASLAPAHPPAHSPAPPRPAARAPAAAVDSLESVESVESVGPQAATTVATTVPPAAVAPSETTPDPGGQTVPIYPTQLPPPLTLHFEMRRGISVGRADLDWRPSADQYQLTLQGQAIGAPGVAWASHGGFDNAGIAPLRYTESRRGREVRAANFQRDSGRITFSGPAIEHPLVGGAQDRLSWMVQLAAVLAANPALATADAQVSMWVVGTRGDAEVWTFTVQGLVPLDLPIDHVDAAVHLVREPRRPYDTQVQVWLDPQRHHLPVQALLLVRATGEGTELRLQGMTRR